MFTCDFNGNRGLSIGTAIIAVLLCAGMTWAAPASADQAGRITRGWLRLTPTPLATRLGDTVGNVETFCDEQGAPLYHVVHLLPRGLVIVPADDQIEPVIAFLDGLAYDPSDGNPLAVLVSRDIANRVAAVRNVRTAKGQSSTAASVAAAKWQSLQVTADGGTIAAATPSISDPRVDPLLQSTWSQTLAGDIPGAAACYNYWTPPGPDGSADNYPCGCVATAMAQLMRFYRYPTAAIGLKSFTYWVDSYAAQGLTRGGDGRGGAYDWSLMPLGPDAGTPLTQRQQIGAICWDSGLAVGMQYSPNFSGAYMDYVGPALKGVFGYSNAVLGYNGGDEIGNALREMLNPNLDAGRPALLAVDNGYIAHAIVADGYGFNQSTLYHHLNLGWSGYDTAWYNLPTIDTSTLQFTTVNTCMYNVFADGVGEIISGRILDQQGNPISGAVVTADKTGGGTYTATTNARGIYALCPVPSAASFVVSASVPGRVFVARPITTGTSCDYMPTSGNRWGVDLTDATGTPAALSVTPAGTTFGAPVGGPFLPGSITYTLTNAGGEPLSWTAARTQDWLGLSATSGTLAAGAVGTITAWVDGSAASLGTGIYTDAVSFTNTSTDIGNSTQPVTLTVGAQAIFTETFEGEFPGENWRVHGTSTTPAWAPSTYTACGGAKSAWCAGSTGLDPSGGYVANMNAWMIYGPFSLEDASTAVVNFCMWLNCQDAVDQFYWGASTDGATFSIYNATGGIGTWQNQTLDLANAGLFGNLCGKKAVWIALFFQSGSSVSSAYKGVFVDNVQIIKNATAPGVLSVTPEAGVSATGPAGGPFCHGSITYRLSNPGEAPVSWQASRTESWVTLSKTSGTLPAGVTDTVTVSLGSSALDLAAGSYCDTITFTNKSNGIGSATRTVALSLWPSQRTPLFCERFEGAFPGDHWQLSTAGLLPTWASTTYQAHSGAMSAWCAGSTGLDAASGYVDGMNATMVCGPFDLSNIPLASVSYCLWLNAEPSYDYFRCAVSTDGTHFYGDRFTGGSASWITQMIDLTAVPTLGNVCGQNQVWIAFTFTSDSSVCGPKYKGAFVDDVMVTSIDMAATLSVTPPSQTIGSAPGTTTFGVANTGGGPMNWTARTLDSWLHITAGASGTDAGSVTVSCEPNLGGVSRTGSITVTAEAAHGSPQTLTVTQSLCGDISGDNHVTLEDLKLLVTAWNSWPGRTNWNPAADLDGDGSVILADLKLLVSNWGK